MVVMVFVMDVMSMMMVIFVVVVVVVVMSIVIFSVQFGGMYMRQFLAEGCDESELSVVDITSFVECFILREVSDYDIYRHVSRARGDSIFAENFGIGSDVFPEAQRLALIEIELE